jgi:fructose-1,6-bisphosphatase I
MFTVHRTFEYAGIFLYPNTSDAPFGKLRVLYECTPVAFIVEKAGGAASGGCMPILDLTPTNLHVRSPSSWAARKTLKRWWACLPTA